MVFLWKERGMGWGWGQGREAYELHIKWRHVWLIHSESQEERPQLCPLPHPVPPSSLPWKKWKRVPKVPKCYATRVLYVGQGLSDSWCWFSQISLCRSAGRWARCCPWWKAPSLLHSQRCSGKDAKPSLSWGGFLNFVDNYRDLLLDHLLISQDIKTQEVKFIWPSAVICVCVCVTSNVQEPFLLLSGSQYLCPTTWASLLFLNHKKELPILRPGSTISSMQYYLSSSYTLYHHLFNS